MGASLYPLYKNCESDGNTLGVLLMDRTNGSFEYKVLVIITEEGDFIEKHYQFKDENVRLFVVDLKELGGVILTGKHKDLLYCLFNGQVLYEHANSIQNIREEKLENFSYSLKAKKMGIEFSMFIENYIYGKRLYSESQRLDTYNHLLQALHYYGKFALLIKGYYPELKVWNQVKKIDPEVYALYKEFVEGEEEISKKIELIQIACDFIVSKWFEVGVSHFISILEGFKRPVSYQELSTHPELIDYGASLNSLLNQMIERGYVRLVEGTSNIKQLRPNLYKVIKKRGKIS